jgi:hypothetical protein
LPLSTKCGKIKAKRFRWEKISMYRGRKKKNIISRDAGGYFGPKYRPLQYNRWYSTLFTFLVWLQTPAGGQEKEHGSWTCR